MSDYLGSTMLVLHKMTMFDDEQTKRQDEANPNWPLPLALAISNAGFEFSPDEAAVIAQFEQKIHQMDMMEAFLYNLSIGWVVGNWHKMDDNYGRIKDELEKVRAQIKAKAGF